MSKEELELERIKQEIKNTVVNRRLGIIKWMVFVIGTLGMFFIVQKPESILNRKSSQETINRERASMVLNLLKTNKQSKDVLVGLKVIDKSYPDTDSRWIEELITYFTKRSEIEFEEETRKFMLSHLEESRDSLIFDFSRKRTSKDWGELQKINDSIANFVLNRSDEKEALMNLFN